MCCAPLFTHRWPTVWGAQKSAPMPRRCPTACGKASWPSTTVPRASYYNYYTENRWGEAKNYDLCLNAALGLDTCADLIVDAAKAMNK